MSLHWWRGFLTLELEPETSETVQPPKLEGYGRGATVPGPY